MILLTGGTGSLGREIKKLMPEVWAPTREELDVLHPLPLRDTPELIIHCAAYTAVDKAEEERHLCMETNVVGTRILASIAPMLYISTDSVFDGEEGGYTEEDMPYPQNFYSLTKMLGELEAIRAGGKAVRCSPRPRPWAPVCAFADRFFSAEYVDQTAAKVVRAVGMFKKLPKVVHIGSKRRSHYDMAIETRPDVNPIYKDDPKGHSCLPSAARRGRDLSLDTSLWESLQ